MKRKLAAAALILLIWKVFSLVIGSDIILPGPEAVFGSLISLIKDPVFYSSLLSTLWKGILSSFLIGAVGIPIGFLMGVSKLAADLMEPIVTVLQSVPVISWLALAIFMWGIGWKGPVLLTFLSLLPVAIINTASGVLNVDSKLVEMAKVFNVRASKVFKVIYLGSLLPFTAATMRIILGNVWKTIVVTEFLCGDKGIGVMISWARSYVDTPKIFALTLVAVALALSFQSIMDGTLGRIVKRWRLF